MLTVYYSVFGNKRSRAEGLQELRAIYQNLTRMNGKVFRNKRGQDYEIKVTTQQINVTQEVIARLI